MGDRDTTQTVSKTPQQRSSGDAGDSPIGFLTITDGENVGQAYPLKLGTTSVGRDSQCQIQLLDTQVSRRHIEIEATNDAVTLTDLKTTNGTYVDGKPVKKTPLKHGDEIRIGLTTLQIALVRPLGKLAGVENLHDHAFFVERLDEEIDRSRRFERSLTVMMLHFADGPATVATAAKKIMASIRTMDLLALYGQNDLELLLPETGKAEAKKLAQGFVKLLKKQSDIKIGLASYPADATNRDQIIELSRVPLWMDQSGASEISYKSGGTGGTSLPKSPAPDAQASGLISDPRLVLHSAKMRSLYETALRIASSPIAVLIQGETGTGKEMVAETIHRQSDRGDKPFVAINCGAFTQSLLESELFGHERGAFTGAEQRKIGLLEAVKGGTLFLDEIGEITPPLQVKLLRVLQDNIIRRVGGTESIKVDFRVISATNRNLHKMVETNNFREDLYYRLNAIILEVPPLRERLDEIPHLANFFLKQYRLAYHKADLQLTQAAHDALIQYHWPGNVRELKNCLERAVVITPGTVIFPENLHLPAPRQSTPKPQLNLRRDETIAGEMRTLLDDYEKQLLVNALQKTGWNQTRAAALLKIPRRTLVSKLKKHGISRP